MSVNNLFYLFYCLVFSLMSSARTDHIIWISGNDNDTGWIKLLEAQGHTVDNRGEDVWEELDEYMVADLEAADLNYCRS